MRPLTWQLQTDFAALCNAYIDHNREELGLSADSKCNPTCVANSSDRVSSVHGIGLAKLLAAWVYKHKHAHSPRSLPIFPAPIPTHGKAKRTKPRLFSSRSNALEKQAVRAYEISRNVNFIDWHSIQ